MGDYCSWGDEKCVIIENGIESVGVNSGINLALSENVGETMQNHIPWIPPPFNGSV